MKSLDSARLQQWYVDTLQADTTLISLLPRGAQDVKELHYQGTDIKYPGVRVNVEEYTLAVEAACPHYSVRVQIVIFSENNSSLQVQNILHAATNALLDKTFDLVSMQGLPIVPSDFVPKMPVGANKENLWAARAYVTQYVIQK